MVFNFTLRTILRCVGHPVFYASAGRFESLLCSGCQMLVVSLTHPVLKCQSEICGDICCHFPAGLAGLLKRSRIRCQVVTSNVCVAGQHVTRTANLPLKWDRPQWNVCRRLKRYDHGGVTSACHSYFCTWHVTFWNARTVFIVHLLVSGRQRIRRAGGRAYFVREEVRGGCGFASSANPLSHSLCKWLAPSLPLDSFTVQKLSTDL